MKKLYLEGNEFSMSWLMMSEMNLFCHTEKLDNREGVMHEFMKEEEMDFSRSQFFLFVHWILSRH